MFGINQITWSEFLSFLLLLLLAWYMLLTAYCWSRSKQKGNDRHFEASDSEHTSGGGFQPIAVYSHELPSKILPVNPVENQRIEASMYEETGMDEGMVLDHFTQKNNPVLAAKLDEYQHQQ
ncbi:hypothetical protein [uncultured Draconibacterium sp.]|uniref:hypothetical protein n=1 Tax=uncultured Draconibacterium sp. TaxID=1573823 RepID=UPI002AA5EB84|nr:hypothetical protein [uncultured Draconibacterium sp.]